jgi:hypothetical protein
MVNTIAWSLGVPFFDAGVLGDGRLARVHLFRPGEDSPCLECMWDERDYEAEQESYSCDGTILEAAPTRAPAALGALAAALLALEIEKMLAGDWEHVATDHEVLIDATSHRLVKTRLQRNPRCRFAHRTFLVKEFPGTPGELTLGDLFALGMTELRVEGQQFTRQWACPACQGTSEIFGLRDRIASTARCGGCGGGGLRPIGFFSRESLPAMEVPAGHESAPLATLGFCAGDIFSGSGGGEVVHFEIGAQPHGGP